MAQKEHVDVYTIPPNFAKEGTILSGRLEARNAVEAAVLALLLLQILMAVDISAKGKIYAGIIVILPVTILAVVGFVFQCFSYVVRRRVITVPNSQYRLKRNRRILKRQKKQQKEEQKKRKGGGGRRKRGTGTQTEAERGEKGGKGSTEGGKGETP